MRLPKAFVTTDGPSTDGMYRNLCKKCLGRNDALSKSMADSMAKWPNQWPNLSFWNKTLQLKFLEPFSYCTVFLFFISVTARLATRQLVRQQFQLDKFNAAQSQKFLLRASNKSKYVKKGLNYSVLFVCQLSEISKTSTVSPALLYCWDQSREMWWESPCGHYVGFGLSQVPPRQCAPQISVEAYKRSV